jgi:exopolysaccharide biosynthesis polyprenyl glycosylphosphotransferase
MIVVANYPAVGLKSGVCDGPASVQRCQVKLCFSNRAQDSSPEVSVIRRVDWEMSNLNITVDAIHTVSNKTSPIPLRFYPSQVACKRIYQALLLIVDATMLIMAFVLAYEVRFTQGLRVFQRVEPSLAVYTGLACLLIPTWLGLFALLRLYELDKLLGGTSEYVRVVNGCTSGMMIVVIASFLKPELSIARGWLVLVWILSCCLICIGRLILRRIAYALRRQGYFISPILIVGTNAEALSLAAQLQDSVYSGVSVIGFVNEDNYGEGEQSALTTLAGWPILGSLEALPKIVEQERIEEVILATTALTREQRLETTLRLTDMSNVKMLFSSGLFEILTTGMQVTAKNSVPLLRMNRLRLDPLEMWLKTVLDYSLVLLAAPILLLLCTVIGLLVKLDSPGPILYRRRVLGVGGKEFDAFKFRTMAVNGDEILARHPDKLAELKATQKIKDDPRVTAVGRWLRALSLDELPQLINVLFGQMSLVGPRMIHPDEAAMYGLYKSNLLTVKPGLTGLWQVSGRSDISYEERVQLDMHYIRNYSIWMDIQILFFQTVPAVFAKRGAY